MNVVAHVLDRVPLVPEGGAAATRRTADHPIHHHPDEHTATVTERGMGCPESRIGGTPLQPEPPGVRAALEVLHRKGTGFPPLQLSEQRQGVVRCHQDERAPCAHGLERAEDRGVSNCVRNGASVELRHGPVLFVAPAGAPPVVRLAPAPSRIGGARLTENLVHVSEQRSHGDPWTAQQQRQQLPVLLLDV